MKQQYECLACKQKMWGESPKHDGSNCSICKGPIVPFTEATPHAGKEWYAERISSTLKAMDNNEFLLRDSIVACEAKVVQRHGELKDHLVNKAFMLDEYNRWATANDMPLYGGDSDGKD